MRNRIALLFAATAVLASCMKENSLAPEQTNDNLVTITAVSADTKTVLNGADVVWEETDEIKVVLDMATDELQDFEASAVDGATATFKGQFAGDVASASQAYAVYPSTAVTMLDNSASIYHTIDAEQYGEIMSGDNLSYASLDVEKLAAGNATATFSNVYSLIKVTVPEGLTEVTIASESPLAGTAPFKMEAGILKVNTLAWASLDQEKTVHLLPSEGDHLEAKTHDVLIFPGTHALTITLTDGTTIYEKTVAAKEYAAATYYNLNLTTVLSAPVTEYLASPFGGGTIEIPFVTTVDAPSYDVQIENGDGWLSYVDVKALTEGTVTLAVATGENTTADRTATVTVTETTSEKSIVVSVTQKCVITDLLGEYLESYTYNYASTTGSLVIARSDDYIQGVYKVTICGVSDLYADYKDGVLSVYEGKFVKTLNVSNDYKQISADNLSVGGKTISNYLAIVSLGPATLSAEEEALVGTYTESWTYNGNPVISENGMVISASEEASYGQLFVKLLTYSGYSFTGYADLDGNVLTVNIGKQKHDTFNKYASIDISLSLVVNNDGTLSFDSWKDANYKDVTGYVATKTATVDPGEGEGEGEGVIITAADLIGTWHEEFVMNGSSISYSEATISLVSGALKVRLFNYVPQWGDPAIIECDAELSVDGSKLTLKTNGITYNYEQFTSDIVLNVSEGGKKLTVSTVSWGYQSISNYTATQL